MELELRQFEVFSLTVTTGHRMLGEEARAVASAAVLALTSMLIAGFVAVGVFPPPAATAAAFPLLAGAADLAASKETAVRLQILLTYPFTATFLAACCTALAYALGDFLGQRAGIV